MTSDTLHKSGDHIEWNESFYFNFYDRHKDVCAFMRIGLKPNKDEKSMFCCIMLPDGSIAASRDSSASADGVLSANGLSYKMVEAERKWSLSFSGPMKVMGRDAETITPCSFDIEFSAKMPIFDYRDCVSGKNERISQSVASEHLEQMGVYSGTVTVGEDTYHISATGERDHSWGARDWNAPKMWMWLTAQASEDLALNVTKLTVEQGEVDAGFIRTDATTHPLQGIDIDARYDESGAPTGFSMIMAAKDGKRYPVEATVIKCLPMPFASDDGKTVSVMYETLSRYSICGKEGFGIAEFLIRKEKKM